MKRKILFILAVLLIFFQSGVTIFHEREKFFSDGYWVTYPALKEAYNNSQYAKKHNPEIMPDEVFEQFAGGAFLRGLNPILIVHDHPPLSRYIVSFSILLFDNPHVIILPFLLLSALGLYLLTKTVIKNPFIALIPLALFVNEPIFISKFIYSPLAEAMQLPFIFFAFYFFIRGLSSKNDLLWFAACSLMIGGVISTRFFILGAAITGSMGLYLLITHKIDRKMIRFVVSLPLALLVLLASYFRTMQLGATPIEILSIQKYILAYHQSKFILPFTFWDLLLFNRWHTWWGDRAIIKDTSWILSWPLATLGTFGLLVKSVRNKFAHTTEPEKILLLWVLVHMIMLSTGYTSSRYFLPLIPLLYILACSFFYKLLKSYVSDRKAHKKT